MKSDKLSDMQRYLLEEEVENLKQRRIGRREFAQRVGLMVGAGATAGLLLSIGCHDDLSGSSDVDMATAPDLAGVVPDRVREDDPAIRAGAVQIADNGFKLTGYRATPAVVPAGAAALLIIHENRALTPYIQDVVRRWGKAGYVALCVDMLSRVGGSAAFPDESTRPAALGQIPQDQSLADLAAGLDYLKAQANVNPDRLGVTGFCFGGGYTWRLATQRADVKAAVAFYGPNPPLADVSKIKAAALGIYGALDTRITGAIGDLETALKSASITYELKVYDGADHAFHNDTGTRYQAEAARDAWQRASAWFAKYV